MANLHIDLPDELHKQLKLQAVKEGASLKQRIIAVLEERL